MVNGNLKNPAVPHVKPVVSCFASSQARLERVELCEENGLNPDSLLGKAFFDYSPLSLQVI